MLDADTINRPCSIIRRSPSGNTDDYGTAERVASVTASVCEIQQRDRSEPTGAGERGVADYLVILPPDEADLETIDAIDVEDVRYEIVGTPWRAWDPWIEGVDHVEATAKQAGGAAIGGS